MEEDRNTGMNAEEDSDLQRRLDEFESKYLQQPMEVQRRLDEELRNQDDNEYAAYSTDDHEATGNAELEKVIAQLEKDYEADADITPGTGEEGLPSQATSA